jgi:hypothetical protein
MSNTTSRTTKQVAFAKGTKPTSNAVNNQDETITLLDPPTFRFFNVQKNGGSSSSDDSSRYELWTIRLPSIVSTEDLEGCSLQLDSSNNPVVSSSSLESKGSKYSFQWGHPVENVSFRVLVPSSAPVKDGSSSSSSSSEDEYDSPCDESSDDDERIPKDKFLVPSSAPFQRHVNVVMTAGVTVSETDVAPRRGHAPTADGVDPIRHAYSHVPQKTGLLKRRWMPLGSTGGGVAAAVVARQRQQHTRSVVTATTEQSMSTVAARVKQEVETLPRKRKSNAKPSSTAKPSSPKRVKRKEDAMDIIGRNSHPSDNYLSPIQTTSAVDSSERETKDGTSSATKKAKKAEKKAKKEKKKNARAG